MSTPVTFREILSDNESLATFMKSMRDFESAFCRAMYDGSDYTLKLEVHGAKGNMIHSRVVDDSFHRPRATKIKVPVKKTG